MSNFKEFTSHISHSTRKVFNPFGEERLLQLLNKLDLKSGERIFEVGAGIYSVLIHLINKFEVSGEGVDLSKRLFEIVQESNRELIQSGKLTPHCADATTFMKGLPDNSFEHSMCMGSTHCLGDLKKTLTEMKRITKVGGLIIIAQGHWIKVPSDEYSEFFVEKDEFYTIKENVKVAHDLNLRINFFADVSRDEWDEYEFELIRCTENFFYQNPDHPFRAEGLKWKREWIDLYLKEGRDYLGFGLYFFRNEG